MLTQSCTVLLHVNSELHGPAPCLHRAAWSCSMLTQSCTVLLHVNSKLHGPAPRAAQSCTVLLYEQHRGAQSCSMFTQSCTLWPMRAEILQVHTERCGSQKQNRPWLSCIRLTASSLNEIEVWIFLWLSLRAQLGSVSDYVLLLCCPSYCLIGLYTATRLMNMTM